jgi:hypothetical protein
MNALILNNVVIQLADSIFPVYSAMQWAVCDNTVQVGYIYSNGQFSAPIVTNNTYTGVTPMTDQQTAALWNSIANNDNTTLNALKLQIGN